MSRSRSVIRTDAGHSVLDECPYLIVLNQETIVAVRGTQYVGFIGTGCQLGQLRLQSEREQPV